MIWIEKWMGSYLEVYSAPRPSQLRCGAKMDGIRARWQGTEEEVVGGGPYACCAHRPSAEKAAIATNVHVVSNILFITSLCKVFSHFGVAQIFFLRCAPPSILSCVRHWPRYSYSLTVPHRSTHGPLWWIPGSGNAWWGIESHIILPCMWLWRAWLEVKVQISWFWDDPINNNGSP
jgi:hypothetical protein